MMPGGVDDVGTEATFEDLLAEAMTRPISGWDFDWLRRRAPITVPLPWTWGQVVAEHAARAHTMLDMGTGGGEVLSGLPRRAGRTVADEAWPPNVAVAAARLRPLGIPVVRDEGAPANAEQDGVRGRLPYRDGVLDLVINRHESFLATEVCRVLRPGGSFVTQQVDTRSFDDLFVALGLEPPAAAASWLPLAREQVEAAGFVVAAGRTGEEHEAFGDVGAVVWYLRAVPWVMPGFDPVAMNDALRRLHRACRDGPLLVRQRRLLVVAEKPAAGAGEGLGLATSGH
jgi:SAM-dependent methyltransferase